MNAQTADIKIAGSKASVEEVILSEQLTRRCPDGNILVAEQLDPNIHAANMRSVGC